MRMRVPASEISLRALGSVHRLSPVLSGVLTTAGVHSLCSLSWKETVPLVKARRPTRPGGSLCAWARLDQAMVAPTNPATECDGATTKEFAHPSLPLALPATDWNARLPFRFRPGDFSQGEKRWASQIAISC